MEPRGGGEEVEKVHALECIWQKLVTSRLQIMKLTVEKWLVVSGLGYLVLATSYTLVYLANYGAIDAIGFLEQVNRIKLLKLKNANMFDSSLIWGLASFWGIMFSISLILWNQNEKKKLNDFLKDETIASGFIPFIISLGYHFGFGLKNNFLLFVCGFYALCTVVLYFQERE